MLYTRTTMGIHRTAGVAVKLEDKLFAIDSTTITLFCDVLKGAGVYGSNGKKKGGLKAHVLTRIKDQVPCFVHLSESARSDRIFMPMLEIPPGSVICMEKAYVNYKVMKAWTKDHISWVTRLADRLRYEILEQKPLTEYHQKKGVRDASPGRFVCWKSFHCQMLPGRRLFSVWPSFLF